MSDLQIITHEKAINQVELIGKFSKEIELSHSFLGERFYEGYIQVRRDSGYLDRVRVIISEYLMDEDFFDNVVQITGEYRSYNIRDNDSNHLKLFVFAKEIKLTEECDANIIKLSGFVCKKPIYRITPLGKCITDITIASNRTYGKSDYIPCIAWNKNAARIAKMQVGDPIEITGRIQSRNYIKDDMIKIAYEVSIINVQ